MAICCFLYPMYSNTSSLLVFLTTKEKLPSISVCAAEMIRSLLSRSVTVAINSGPSESLYTLPEILVPFCANAVLPNEQKSTSKNKCFILIMANYVCSTSQLYSAHYSASTAFSRRTLSITLPLLSTLSIYS